MADELELTAGSIDITPPRPISLAGFIRRSGAFDRVADALEVNAILLRSAGQTFLLLSADLLYAGSRLEVAAKQGLEQAGVADAKVLAAATHTHFAPNVDETKPLLGNCDPGYCELVESRVVELVEKLATEPPTPVQIRYGVRQAHKSVNRRKRVWGRRGVVPCRSWRMRANPRGPTDQSLHLMRLDDADGRTRAIVWSYGCHPVAFPDRISVTAEFPGVVRQRLRESVATLPVLFLQGFSGDIRPPAVADLGSGPRRRIAAALRGTPISSFSEEAYVEWSGSLASLVADLAGSDSLEMLRPELRHGMRTLPLAQLINGYPGDQDLRVVRLQLANDLQLLAVSAEVVVDYTRHLCAAFPGTRTIPVGCVGSVYGYLPTAKMLGQGGYEVEEFFGPFSLTGRFHSSVEARVVRAIRALADEPAAPAERETPVF